MEKKKVKVLIALWNFAISNPSYPILFPAIPQNQLSSRVRGTYHLVEGERRLSPHTETKLLVLIF